MSAALRRDLGFRAFPPWQPEIHMASKAQQRRHIQNSSNHQQEIVKIIQRVARRFGVDRVWRDWIEICAIALAKLDLSRAEARETRYLEVVGRYERDELDLLVQAFAHLQLEFQTLVEHGDFADVLGATYMMLDLGNAETGQFFTPYCVSRLMAGMIMGSREDLAATVAQRGFVRVHEPAVGAGGMVVAAAQAIRDVGVDYWDCMHVSAIDVDLRCVHMAYIQFTLLGIPAVVVHGNALTLAEWDHWYTVAHIANGWSERLRLRRMADQMLDVISSTDIQTRKEAGPAPAVAAVPAQPEAVLVEPARAGQMMLF
ncbi:SAM-dependent DNA methyltransferase [Achromobacter sp. GG226]|uniref:N-6 DNA methylase n=1 Tax=Verticiella alkaliphila TaxID=2779529 RepID=UPI001C0CB5D1|nr:N-6 DNA methylase [Verticiella sp. GG226]MBU4610344.1 SAM-dependent DNA methyltransferase [Verticiella sp. GG226]